MGDWARRAARRVGLCLLLGLAASGTVTAEQVKLKDGTEFSATVLGKDRDSVVVRLPRSEVSSVNGQPLPMPVTTGVAAPGFEAVDLAGAMHRLANYQGHVTLLQFWATWCPHCRADLSLMKDLFVRYQAQGLRILTVSVDQDLATLQSFIQEQHVSYPVIPLYSQSVPSQQAALPELYDMQGIPAYYLIDTQGTINQTFTGSVTEGGIDLEGALKRLLAVSGASRSSVPSSN